MSPHRDPQRVGNLLRRRKRKAGASGPGVDRRDEHVKAIETARGKKAGECICAAFNQNAPKAALGQCRRIAPGAICPSFGESAIVSTPKGSAFVLFAPPITILRTSSPMSARARAATRPCG